MDSAADKLLDALTDALLLGSEDSLDVLLGWALEDASNVASSLTVCHSEGVSRRVV